MHSVFKKDVSPNFRMIISINNNNYYIIIAVAEDVLNMCTVNDPQYPNPDDENYTVAFNYEFIEDTSAEVNRYRILYQHPYFPGLHMYSYLHMACIIL